MKQAILQTIILLGLAWVLFGLGWHGVALGALAVIFYAVLPDVLAWFYDAVKD